MINRKLVSASLLAFFLAFLGTQSLALADSYSVTAKVKYPPPTQPAVIDHAINNSTVPHSYFNVSGTCQISSPAYIITILRRDKIMGSGTCSPQGTFSIYINLRAGKNTLIARTTNISGLQGPDSAEQVVTLTLPTSPIVIPSQKPVDKEIITSSTSVTQQQIDAIDAGAQTNLTISTSHSFAPISDGKSVEFNLEIDGGKTPYTYMVNWGDSTTTSATANQPGTVTLRHTYKEHGSYRVVGQVWDVLGAVTRFEYIASSETNTSQTNSEPIHPNGPPPPDTRFDPAKSMLILAASTLGATTIAGLSAFYLGKQIGSQNAVKAKPRKRRK